MTKVNEGNVGDDLRCNSLFTVCHKRRRLSEQEETKLDIILSFAHNHAGCKFRV